MINDNPLLDFLIAFVFAWLLIGFGRGVANAIFRENKKKNQRVIWRYCPLETKEEGQPLGVMYRTEILKDIEFEKLFNDPRNYETMVTWDHINYIVLGKYPESLDIVWKFMNNQKKEK